MQRQFVISIMTRDRVGIIADISESIRILGGNLGELSQTVLYDYFTMIVMASFPESVEPGQIETALARLDTEVPFEIGLKEIEAPPRDAAAGSREGRYVLTAVGPDQPGFVATLTRHLSERGINIQDVDTAVAEGQYTMILQLDIPPQLRVAALKDSLHDVMKSYRASCEIQHNDIFRATNEI